MKNNSLIRTIAKRMVEYGIKTTGNSYQMFFVDEIGLLLTEENVGPLFNISQKWLLENKDGIILALKSYKEVLNVECGFHGDCELNNFDIQFNERFCPNILPEIRKEIQSHNSKR